MKIILSLILFLSFSLLVFSQGTPTNYKPRVINTTDLGADPDDEQSMVRQLVSSNEFDIEGLIVSTGCWKKSQSNTDMLDKILDAYAEAYPNLKVHADGFPTPEYLRSIAVMGQTGYGMDDVGAGKDSPGSELIIASVDKDDPRPVWVMGWGGMNNAAQAIWKVRETRSEAEFAKFLSKLRLFDILGQDDAGAWIAKNFPEVLYIRATGVYGWAPSDEQLKDHIQSHGPLGAVYPDRVWATEGDTPAFMHVYPTGLNDPDEIDQGGWGGRFSFVKKAGIRSMSAVDKASETMFDPYFMYGNSAEGSEAIKRWEKGYNNDFAARMDWSISPRYEDANHHPVAVLNGDPSRQVLEMTATAGDVIQLSAAGSSDPDGDALHYSWSFYDEPSSYDGSVTIKQNTSATASLEIPENASSKNIHIILQIHDDGAPNLYAYRRLIIKVQASEAQKAMSISGELKKWHTITLTFDGPQTSETDEENPFLHYRLDVTFFHKKTGKAYKVPGYFAADGQAAMSSATAGNKWRVHFSPDEIGEWTYSVDFKKGKWVAIRSRDRQVPSGAYMDGAGGTFSIQPTDKTGRDFRAHGRLEYVGERYLRFAETGRYFYKCGSDAPENFLAYTGFDGDFASDGHKDELVKTWGPHLKDWKEGDPQWSRGRGKEIIGALNYLSSKGLNAFSFLTNNIEGDDRNVFPYINYDTWDRFDCSKLDQWEIVFDHAQKNGLFLHFKTMEFENQGLLDFGGIGGNTKLYYRELIARFGHHLAMNWNLTEEYGDWGRFDGATTMPKYAPEYKTLAQYLYDTDPYHHHMVIHNGEEFDPFYGEASKLSGASLQTSERDFRKVNQMTQQVIERSAAAGKIWAVACDEPGDASHALITDEEDPEHYHARTNGLWGHMLAGGWGTEWYFGYKHPHSDLSCQDYRSRDLFWDMGVLCINFFEKNDFPVTEMSSHNELISSEGDFCFAKEGDTYIALLKKGGESQLNLKELDGKYSVKWFDPRKGGSLQDGTVKSIEGSGMQSLGTAPNNPEKDWVVVIRKAL